MWPGPPSGAAGETSLTSRISTRRLVRFLILMATSCGLKVPHTITRPCFLSIRWLSSSSKTKQKKEGFREVSQTEVFRHHHRWAAGEFTLHLEERPPDPLVAPVAVDVHPQGHAVGRLQNTGYTRQSSLTASQSFSSRKPILLGLTEHKSTHPVVHGD